MRNIAIDFFEQRKSSFLNTLHTWLLVGGSLFLLAVCAFVFFGWSGILYAAIFGGISLFMASRVSPKIVLKMYKAKLVDRQQFTAGHEILDELMQRSGLDKRPELYVVPSEMMNAFAVGRQHNCAIAMTDKLITAMTRNELAGIMAHEVTHIINEDVKVMAIADMVSRFTSMMSTFGIISLVANIPSILFGGGVAVPWIAVILFISAPTIGGLLQLALSRTREYDADLGAVMLTGDPDSLASALVKLEKAMANHGGRNWEGMVLPGGRVPHPSILRTHPKTVDRIERLMALKEDTKIIEEVARGEPNAKDIIPEEVRSQLPKQTSPVPKIKKKWGRGEGSKYSDYATLLNTDSPKPISKNKEGDCIACEHSLNLPENKPRIRIRSGGVWY